MTGERFSEAFSETFSEVHARLAKAAWIVTTAREREMWAVAFLPQPDAPALGWYPNRTTWPGAEAILVGVPPVVERPDPVADLIKAYRLINDAPMQPIHPDPRWHKFAASDLYTPDPGADGGDQERMERIIADLTGEAYGKLKEAAALAQRAGCALCVHDGPTAQVDGVGDGGEDFHQADTVRLQVRIRAHMIWPGQVCQHVPRTQYGEPTA